MFSRHPLVLLLALTFAPLCPAASEDTSLPKPASDLSFEELQKAAAKDDAAAQFTLGCMYHDGIELPPDPREAVKWWRKAAFRGHVKAQSLLGVLYETAGVDRMKQNLSEAAKWDRMAAEQGDPVGQARLGALHVNGVEVPKDYTEAMKWIRKSAEQGYAEGQFLAGEMHRMGYGVPKDAGETLEWWRKAAEQGYTRAQIALGTMLLTGDGVAKDSTEALKWLRKAGEPPDRSAPWPKWAAANACRNSLKTSYSGEVVQMNVQDDGKAVPEVMGGTDTYLKSPGPGPVGPVYQWQHHKFAYRASPDLGDAATQRLLGDIYHNGTGVPVDHAEAARWYLKAANQGNAGAQAELGGMLLSGEGVPKDSAKALDWLNKAVQLKSVKAMDTLGTMYLDGNGVPKNRGRAMDFFFMDNEPDAAPSQPFLILKHYPGVKVSAKYSTALAELGALAAQGDPAAEFLMAFASYAGKGMPQSYPDAEKWCRKAIAHGNADADYLLAILQETGKYKGGKPLIKPSPNEVFKAYRRLAEQGDARVMPKLAEMYQKRMQSAPPDNIPADLVETRELLQKLAEAGDPGMQHILGQTYLANKRGMRDESEAKKWESKAAEQGNIDAQAALGDLCIRSEDADEVAEGVKWLRKAGEAGHYTTQLNLGNMYLHGDRVPQDNDEGLRWYQKTEDSPESRGAMLGDLYYQDGEIIPQDYEKALKHYLLWTEKHGAGFESRIAEMYRKGLGTPKNPAEALKWWLRETYSMEGRARIGEFYYNGEGVKQDYAKAMQWWRTAWGPEAEVLLGGMYYDGKGTLRNYPEAVKHYRIAAGMQSGEGAARLGHMYEDGKGVQRNDIEALARYNLAVRHDNKAAETDLEALGKLLGEEKSAAAALRADDLEKTIEKEVMDLQNELERQMQQ